MSGALTGVVEGGIIRLDSPAPGLDGQRVRIRLERLEEQPEISDEEQRRMLSAWAARGPQGPLDGPEGWPDEAN